MNTNECGIDRLRVAVILVNWNNWRDCIECIDTLLAQGHHNVHLFVVDNDSRDGSVDRISDWCRNPRAASNWKRHSGVDRFTDAPGALNNGVSHTVVEGAREPSAAAREDALITLIRAGGNPGFAGGCNAGVAAAGLESFDYFWFLNSDTVVHRDALSRLLERAAVAESVGMVGSSVRFYDRPDVVQAMGGAALDMRTMRAPLIGTGLPVAQIPVSPSVIEPRLAYVFGASMLVSAAFIREVGPMQEDYFLYYEEFDWAQRGRRSGYTLGYAPDSHVFHKSGASSSKIMPEFTSHYYYRNRVRFTARFFPDQLTAVKRGLLIELIRHCLRGRWAIAKIVASALRDASWLAAQSAGSGSSLAKVDAA